jgi:hypothetical protein
MNKKFLILRILAAITLLAIVYGAMLTQAQAATLAVPKAAAYEAILGRSLSDKAVDDFIVRNRCSSTGQFQICNKAGMALWIGQSQEVETVYLYPNQIQDFEAYNGELPLGLSATDTMASVEDKFGQPKVERVPQAGWVPGLPDESATPDHFHYWAMYKRFGVTIVYNSPSAAAKDASIYAILVNK